MFNPFKGYSPKAGEAFSYSAKASYGADNTMMAMSGTSYMSATAWGAGIGAGIGAANGAMSYDGSFTGGAFNGALLGAGMGAGLKLGGNIYKAGAATSNAPKGAFQWSNFESGLFGK